MQQRRIGCSWLKEMGANQLVPSIIWQRGRHWQFLVRSHPKFSLAACKRSCPCRIGFDRSPPGHSAVRASSSRPPSSTFAAAGSSSRTPSPRRARRRRSRTPVGRTRRPPLVVDRLRIFVARPCARIKIPSRLELLPRAGCGRRRIEEHFFSSLPLPPLPSFGSRMSSSWWF